MIIMYNQDCYSLCSLHPLQPMRLFYVPGLETMSWKPMAVCFLVPERPVSGACMKEREMTTQVPLGEKRECHQSSSGGFWEERTILGKILIMAIGNGRMDQICWLFIMTTCCSIV